MGKCKQCGVIVKGGNVCPLCGRKVHSSREERMYPPCGPDTQEDEKKPPYWQLVITFCAVGICALINLETRESAGGYWYLDIAAIFAYLWILVLHTVKSASQGSLKLFLQACIVVAMLCIFDWNAGAGGWSVHFGIPIVSIGFTALATYIVATHKVSWSEYIGYLIAVVLLGQMPTISAVLGFVRLEWLGLSAVGYSLFTFLIMLMFANGRYRTERVRRLRF